MSLRSLPLFPVSAAHLSSTLNTMHVGTHAPAHVSRRVPGQECPVLSALLLCFQLSPGSHSLCPLAASNQSALSLSPCIDLPLL
ncbi:hypothetical protein PBY51_005000 [Eleginops maclovinus]|uniref:Uncharacterized protein n=1 Tax=Eleginops maclovinus TaxID=56733 RepID=A0AAN7X6F3_ELEMC|nr:hypothetical protein PBY51_005000 [Eleginops maclovinus]